MAPVLGYWRLRGLMCPIQYALEYANAPYTMKYYNVDQEGKNWKDVKFTLGLDFPNLPYYMDGDMKLSQSMAILRHIGRKYGLDGSTEAEKRLVDQALYQGQEMRVALITLYFNWNEEAKKKYLNPDERNNQGYYLKLLESYLAKRNFVAGEKVTIADFVMWEFLDWLQYGFPDSLKKYPKVQAYYNRVRDLPSMKNFRTKTDKYIEWPLTPPFAKFGGQKEDRLVRYPK